MDRVLNRLSGRRDKRLRRGIEKVPGTAERSEESFFKGFFGTRFRFRKFHLFHFSLVISDHNLSDVIQHLCGSHTKYGFILHCYRSRHICLGGDFVLQLFRCFFGSLLQFGATRVVVVDRGVSKVDLSLVIRSAMNFEDGIMDFYLRNIGIISEILRLDTVQIWIQFQCHNRTLLNGHLFVLRFFSCPRVKKSTRNPLIRARL